MKAREIWSRITSAWSAGVHADGHAAWYVVQRVDPFGWSIIYTANSYDDAQGWLTRNERPADARVMTRQMWRERTIALWSGDWPWREIAAIKRTEREIKDAREDVADRIVLAAMQRPMGDVEPPSDVGTSLERAAHRADAWRLGERTDRDHVQYPGGPVALQGNTIGWAPDQDLLDWIRGGNFASAVEGLGRFPRPQQEYRSDWTPPVPGFGSGWAEAIESLRTERETVTPEDQTEPHD